MFGMRRMRRIDPALKLPEQVLMALSHFPVIFKTAE